MVDMGGVRKDVGWKREVGLQRRSLVSGDSGIQRLERS